jgi:hypothetical protein
MKAALKIIAIIVPAFIAVSTIEAGIIYVPGDYPTIQQGIDASSPTDTVAVASGTYAENINISVPNHPLTLASMFLLNGDTSAISNTVIDGGNAGTTITIQPYDHIVIEIIGFTIINGLGTGNWPNVHGGGIHTGDSVFARIDHCRFHDNLTAGESNRGAGIYMNSSYSRISNCVFYDNQSRFGPAIAVGNYTYETVIDSCEMYDNVCTDTNFNNLSVISITYSYNIAVRHCLVHHNNGSGIRNWGSYVTNVVNCTISGNGGYGIYNSYFNADIYVQNTIAADNVLSALFNNDMYNPAVLCEYSDMMGSAGMPWFGEGCLDRDPMFADTLARDYSLQVGSPCIDTGDPDSPLDPDGTVADMGAICHMATGMEKDPGEIPGHLAVLGNYPNPFNAATTFEYVLGEETEVEISVYNLLGQKIETIFSGRGHSGENSIVWNADKFPSGVYFARLRTPEITRNLKMSLLK